MVADGCLESSAKQYTALECGISIANYESSI